MTTAIKLIATWINDFHDLVMKAFAIFFPQMSDKDLHFWIIGLFGILFFFMVNYIFKRLGKFPIEIISLIYTFTVLLVIVFALEIQQKVTNRGVMDFNDVVAGIKGFFAFFGIYLIYRLLVLAIKKIFHKRRERT